MKDRRFCERVDLNFKCVIYIGAQEIICNIKDISASGIGILIDDPKAKIDENDVIRFQFLDEKDKAIIDGQASIVRCHKSDNGQNIGCSLVYISDEKYA